MFNKMKYKTVSSFTMEEIDGKLTAPATIDLKTDIPYLFDQKQEIEGLFKNPSVYIDGDNYKFKIQKLIEFYYFKVIEAKNVKMQILLLNIIYSFYKTIDSLALQESIIFQLEQNAAEAYDIQFAILIYFYTFNAEAFRMKYDENNFIIRAYNQKRILRFFMSFRKIADLLQYEESLAKSDIQTQIFKNVRLETDTEIQDDYYETVSRKILSEEKLDLLKISLRNSWSDEYFIQDIYDMGLPTQIGYMKIKTRSDQFFYERLLQNTTLAIEYRVYALLLMASFERNPFSKYAVIERLLDLLDSERVITENLENTLRDDIKKMLNNTRRLKLSTGDNHFNSMETEMLFTAMAVLLHEKYPDVNLIDFLKQLKFTFVNDNNTEFIILYSGSDEAEYIRIPFGDKEEYINSIKNFVESIYKQNKGEVAVKDKKIETVSRGYLKMIKLVKKNKN